MIKKNSDKPYTDIKVTDRYIIREFAQNIDPIELMWHRDDEDRQIDILECGEGWKFQYDEDLPLNLEPNDHIFILRHQWHRIWKGEGKLKVKIHLD